MSTDAELRAAIDALTKQVASLEASLAAPLEASHARWATQLQSRLTTLAARALLYPLHLIRHERADA